MRRVDARDIVLEIGAVDLRRQAGDVEAILDADRQTVDRGERPARLPARARRVGGLACPRLVEPHERLDLRLARGDLLQTPLQIGARRVAAVGKGGARLGETEITR